MATSTFAQFLSSGRGEGVANAYMVKIRPGGGGGVTEVTNVCV